MAKKIMMNTKLVFLVAVTLMLAFVCGFLIGIKYERLDFVRVIDGDTFVVKNRRDGQEWRVRLWGVNAPDTKECYYDQSTEVLTSMLKNKKITYQRYGYDGYGRILAEVYINGENLEEKLMIVGAVKVYDGIDVHDDLKPSEVYVESLKNIELLARKKKIGVWSEMCASR